jgi:hypothetical protein
LSAENCDAIVLDEKNGRFMPTAWPLERIAAAFSDARSTQRPNLLARDVAFAPGFFKVRLFGIELTPMKIDRPVGFG